MNSFCVYATRKFFGMLLLLLAISTIAFAEKENFAVIGIKSADGVSQGEADILADRLRIELFNTGSVSMMERDQMQEIMKEQGFQQSGACTDEACMIELGQMLGVQKLIGGSIGKLGSMFLVNLRTIDVQTAKISKVVSVDINGGIEDVVKYLPNIAMQLVSGVKAPAIDLVPKSEIATNTEPIEIDDFETKDESIEKEDEEDEVISISDSKNKNRGGVRINITTFSKNMMLSVTNPDSTTKEDSYAGTKDEFESFIAENYSYSNGVYKEQHLRFGLAFMIRAGKFLAIDIGPKFGKNARQYSYDSTYYNSNLSSTVVKSYDVNNRLISPGIGLGINFVKRFSPIKLNLGFLVDMDFNILLETESYEYDHINLYGSTDNYEDREFNVSIGPRTGIEILAGKYVGFNFDFVYMYKMVKFEQTITGVEYIYDYTINIRANGIGFGFGVNFYF